MKLWLAALCLGAFLTASAVAFGVFEGIPHLEDEHAQYFQAQVFAAGRWSVPERLPAPAFRIAFTVDHNGQTFSKYPPGFAALLAPFALLGQPWLANALAAALSVLGVFNLARDLFGERTALLAAGLGVVSPTFVMLSGTLLPHMAELALLVWFACAFLRARRPQGRQRLTWASASGLLLGVALAVRPFTAALTALPFLALGLVDLARAPKTGWPVLLRLGTAALLPLALWGAYNWAATGWPLTNTYTLLWPYDAPGFGLQYGLHGHTLDAGLWNVEADLKELEEMALGWPAWFGVPALWVVIGLGLALPPRRLRREVFLLAPLAALSIAMTTYWTRSAGLYGPRYYFEVMPFLWILAARGLLKLERWRLPRLALFALLPVWTVWSVGFILPQHFAEGRGLYEITRADARALQAAHLDNALVFVHAPEWNDYARLSWLNRPMLDQGRVIYARSEGPSANAFVREQFPGRAVYTYDRTRTPALQPCPDPCPVLQPAPDDSANGP